VYANGHSPRIAAKADSCTNALGELRLESTAASAPTRDFPDAEGNLLILFIKLFIPAFGS
jgi:hypothetical protein